MGLSSVYERGVMLFTREYGCVVVDSREWEALAVNDHRRSLPLGVAVNGPLQFKLQDLRLVLDCGKHPSSTKGVEYMTPFTD